MSRKETDLPFGDAFSPTQLETADDTPPLVTVLELVAEYEGRPDAFDREIAARFFEDSSNPPTRAKNVRLGLGQNGYQLVDEEFTFTDTGRELYQQRHDPDAMHESFAKHILLHLDGLKILSLIEDLEARGARTTNSNLKQSLRDQYDMHIDRTSNHWSQMRAWLAEADLVNTGSVNYEIDWNTIRELTGVDADRLLDLDDLTDEQLAFLKALVILNPDGQIENSSIRKVAEEAFDVEISQSNISRRVLNPLADAGYLEWENPSTVTGKPNLVKTTDSFEADVLGPIITQVSDRVGVPRRILRLSLPEAYNQLETTDGYDRGLALEALAIKLGEALGLNFAGWRVRGQATGGSEVDVLMDDVGATHTRWQIQCKSALDDRITADTVAREVGVAHVVDADTLLLVVRGGMTDEADRFATQVMQRTSLTVLKLTEADLEAIVETPDVLYSRLAGQAERAQRIKRLDPGRADLALPGEGIQTEGSTIMDEMGLTKETEETASTDLFDFAEDS